MTAKITPKRHFGIEHAVLELFFYILVFELACHLERFVVEYDYCVSAKISPKRHFGIEHAVLGLFFVWDDFSSVLAKIIPKQGTLEYEHVNWELVLVSDDPCVAVKITPKRQFRIEHAVLGFFLYISFWAGMPFGEIRSWIWLTGPGISTCWTRLAICAFGGCAVWSYISFSPNLPSEANTLTLQFVKKESHSEALRLCQFKESDLC